MMPETLNLERSYYCAGITEAVPYPNGDAALYDGAPYVGTATATVGATPKEYLVVRPCTCPNEPLYEFASWKVIPGYKVRYHTCGLAIEVVKDA